MQVFTVYVRGESEKNVGCLADCDMEFSHTIVVNKIFP